MGGYTELPLESFQTRKGKTQTSLGVCEHEDELLGGIQMFLVGGETCFCASQHLWITSSSLVLTTASGLHFEISPSKKDAFYPFLPSRDLQGHPELPVELKIRSPCLRVMLSHNITSPPF